MINAIKIIILKLDNELSFLATPQKLEHDNLSFN